MYICSVETLAICAFVLIVTLNVIEINRKTKGECSLLVLSLITSFTFIFVCIPTATSLPIFWMFKEIIRFYLKTKHGLNFAGLVEGADVMHMCNKTENSLVSVLIIFECTDDEKPEDIYENFKNIMDKHLIQNRDKLTKYHCLIKSCLGYFYMIKQYITIEDCVKKMDIMNSTIGKLSKKELITLLTKYSNEPLPKDNTVMWDIYVGTQPIHWKTDARDNVKYYPVMYRLHHAIADGFDFVQLLAGVVADKSNENSKEAFILKSKEVPRIVALLHNLAISLYTFIFFSSHFLLENWLLKKEHNILQSDKLTNTDVMAIKVDNGKYLLKIKRLKNALPDTSFSDILLTAFSASISEHFQKHSSQQSEHLRLVMPFLRKAMLLPQMPVGQLTLDDISCHNSFSMLTLDFPLCPENNKHDINKNSALLQRLNAIKKETRRCYNSMENKMTHFWSHIGLQLFPFPIFKKLYDMLDWTAILSILPGPPKLVLGNGKLPIYDIVFWIPHLARIGCSFSILTYDNRLQLGLNIDRAIISNEEHAQNILDGILKYLDLLEEEIELQKQLLPVN